MLDDAVLERLRFQRMIFHVVGPKDDDLDLMDEIDATGFESFFLQRVRETNIGNRFDFIGEEQGIKPTLNAMISRPNDFVSLSKQLAESFHNQHRNVASSKGAFIIASVTGATYPIFALIKFDDMQVLRFRQEKTPEGRIRAVVSEIGNTFVEDKKAMQKSALIALSDDGGSIAVYDRTNRKDIGQYFKTFLGVKRLYTPTEATTRFKKALEAAFRDSKEFASDETKRSWRQRLRTESEARTSIDPETDLEGFGTGVFGSLWQDQRFRSSLDRHLQAQRVSGEVIELDITQIPAPRTRRIKTLEDVLIIYPRSLDDAVNIVDVQRGADGSATITIRTQRILDDELLGEGSERRPPG
ncbi:nucleoid-associated protein [Kaistia terrae]|uniref:Nucleoid-associated protein n=1 Tax=Kaistia terrae TaxID=537017 RepID=A0ABW0PWT9_9HYPH|nr:nucleoid-associated protein [Kaistia terrae]MCX5579455.1 nucleoid-associated protein [Kaistia terrae]